MLKFSSLTLFFILYCGSVKSQDSTRVRLINHEIGFNAVGLLSQFKFFTPTGGQSPFLIFYNLYYKDLIGFRLGAGVYQDYKNITIDELNPTVSNTSSADLRAGFSYNFAKHKRITLNGFADFLYNDRDMESISTSTVYVQGNQPRENLRRSHSLTVGTGIQAGVGIKINIHKMLSLYAELPVSHMTYKTNTQHTSIVAGQESFETKSTGSETSAGIGLPTTVYLILRF